MLMALWREEKKRFQRKKMKQKKEKKHPTEANVNRKILSSRHRAVIYTQTHVSSFANRQRPLFAWDRSLPNEEKRRRREREKKRKKKITRINKSMAPVTHTHIHIIFLNTTDSGNEAASNPFVVLLSDIFAFRIND